jgi:hypothetical protein
MDTNTKARTADEMAWDIMAHAHAAFAGLARAELAKLAEERDAEFQAGVKLLNGEPLR